MQLNRKSTVPIKKLFPKDELNGEVKEVTICDIQSELKVEANEEILDIDTTLFESIFQVEGFQEKVTINGKNYSFSGSLLSLINAVFQSRETNTFMELDQVKNNLDASMRYNIGETLELQKKQNFSKADIHQLMPYFFREVEKNLMTSNSISDEIKVYLLNLMKYLSEYANFYASRSLIQDCNAENIRSNVVMQEQEKPGLQLQHLQLPDQLLQCISPAEQTNDILYEYRHSSYKKLSSRLLLAEKEYRQSRRTLKNALYSKKEEFEKHNFYPQTINCPNGAVIQFQGTNRDNKKYVDIMFSYLDAKILLTLDSLTYDLSVIDPDQKGISFADWCATYPGGSAFAKRVESIICGSILQTMSIDPENSASSLKKIFYDSRVAISSLMF